MMHGQTKIKYIYIYIKWHSAAPTGQIFMKFDIWAFFEEKQTEEKSQVSLKSDENGGALRDDLYTYTFMIEPRSVLFKMRSVWGKTSIENQNTHFIFDIVFPKILQFMK